MINYHNDDQIDDLKVQINYLKKTNNGLKILLDQNEQTNMELENLLKNHENSKNYLERKIDQYQNEQKDLIDTINLQNIKIDEQCEQILTLKKDNDELRKPHVNLLEFKMKQFFYLNKVLF